MHFQHTRVICATVEVEHVFVRIDDPPARGSGVYVSGALRAAMPLGGLAGLGCGWLARCIARRQLLQRKALAEKGIP